MNERINELRLDAGISLLHDEPYLVAVNKSGEIEDPMIGLEKFAWLIVKEMCGLMEQAEDDCYHCFEPSERPTDYIAWLNQWRTRFEEHFGVE